MIKLINNGNSIGYTGDIYITQNVYDIIRYIDGREEDTRILHDSNINTWYIGDALDHIHRSFVIEGWKNGLYHEYDFKTEEDVLNYYGNTTFIFLYYYKEVPYKPNLTGDYEIHYVYDFGIIDSHDILFNIQLKYEQTELYKILKPRMIDVLMERTKN